MTKVGKVFRQFVYVLSCMVMLGGGGYLLFLGVTLENHIWAGLGVAFGMVIGALGLAAFLELSRLGGKLSGWLK